jgi:hypothetical protein
MYVSCIHILGNDTEKLPPGPFKRLQLVFLDLHLNGTIGKNAASHTANVFTKIVSPETAPIVVVIWSKYAKVVSDGEDETDAELFKRMLLEAVPGYDGRLIFIEMAKPQSDAQPANWAEVLKTEIANALNDQQAVGLLWSWDSMVRDATVGVSKGLTAIASSSKTAATPLKDALKEAMHKLAKAQAEGDFSAATAPAHLVTVLTELLTDELEYSDSAAVLAHGAWLATAPATGMNATFLAHMNSLLLTAAITEGAAPFLPGTVYHFRDPAGFASFFGVHMNQFLASCGTGTGGAATDPGRKAWMDVACPVLVEISPACDVAQKTRTNAMLIAGVIVPAAVATRRKTTGVFDCLPIFHLRWPAADFPQQDAALVFCHRFKSAIPASAVPDLIEPWFRLRDLPTSSLRAAHAGHSARIGYVSV